MTENEGFSVVAPISRIVPFSTCGRKASCCALLNRWISSMNRIVRRFLSASRAFAWSMTALTSLMPLMTALSGWKAMSVWPAMRRASVVLPQPGGPHRMREWSAPRASMRRSGESGPATSAWPIQSSNERGRIRSASGWCAAGRSPPPSAGSGGSGLSSNRSTAVS